MQQKGFAMLCITRNQEERIRITVPPSAAEQVILLTHCGFNHQGEVRIGIEAPREITVARYEVGQPVRKK
jgi:sRNA-binding carbon storage regulator CsrA